MAEKEPGTAARAAASVADGIASVRLLGVRVHTLPLATLIDVIALTITQHRRALIAYVNAHAMNLAYESPAFRAFLNQRADIVFCDGFGVKWGARLLGLRIPERYTPPDWIAELARMCVAHGFSLFLLGARPGVAERAAARLQECFPRLRIVGTHHGYFDKAPGNRESEAVISKINAAQPHLLLVGFGMPLQEEWVLRNCERLKTNVVITAGALFDYVAGTLPRGPRWMTDHGLEWLARLAVEPPRLWKRYLVGNPLFLWRVLKSRFVGVRE